MKKIESKIKFHSHLLGIGEQGVGFQPPVLS